MWYIATLFFISNPKVTGTEIKKDGGGNGVRLSGMVLLFFWFPAYLYIAFFFDLYLYSLISITNIPFSNNY